MMRLSVSVVYKTADNRVDTLAGSYVIPQDLIEAERCRTEGEQVSELDVWVNEKIAHRVEICVKSLRGEFLSHSHTIFTI